MTFEWSTSAVRRGRLLELQLPANGPRGAALESAIRQAIRDGRLVSGDSLPSSRALAEDLGLARGTVVDAYEQLAAEGWLQTKRGAATMVTGVATAGGQPPGPAPSRAAGARSSAQATGERQKTHASKAAQSNAQLLPARPMRSPKAAAQAAIAATAADRVVDQRGVIDLRPRHPDLSAFPRRLWMSAVRHALQTAPDEALGNTETQGRIELRTAVAGMLARARGVVADPDRIVICSGYTQGLGLVASALRRQGAMSMAMEDPGLSHHRDVVLARGLAVVPIPVDEQGARTFLLHHAGAAAFVATPSHQHPLGMAMSAQRRTSLLEWANWTGGLVIEDDYDSEFRYDRQSPGALQARAPQDVIYGGTVSKTLASGLRVGWLVVPEHLVGAIVDEKRSADTATSPIDQLAIAHMITSGEYERHIRKMRLVYRQRRDELIRLLTEHVPDIRVEGLSAGLHAVLYLPEGGTSESDVEAAAAQAGVLVGTLRSSWHRPGKHPQALLVSYAAPAAHTFAASMERLLRVLSEAVPSM